MLTALAIVFGVGVANDANWVSFGGAGAFVPHKTIRMLGEDINIALYDDKIHVRVYFSFENKGPATTVKMAFPFSTVNWNEDLVRSFSSKVDGKPTPVEKLVNVPMLPGEKETLEEKWSRNVIYVKSVEFEEGQSRTVLVDYTTGRGFAGGGYLFDSYIISTGASWAGTIGTISISVDWNKTKHTSRPDLDLWRENETQFKATWAFLDKKHATTTITNVEPDFDLGLGSVNGFWNVWVDGERVDSFYGVSGEDGPCLKGDPKDPLVVTKGLGKVLHHWAEKVGFIKKDGWVYPQFVEDIPDASTLVLQKERRVVMRRKIRNELGDLISSPSLSDYVFLRDFVDAIGGKMVWDESQDRIDITLPK